MFRAASLALLILATGLVPAFATDNGPGPKGSTQREAYCQFQLLDCTEAAEDNCSKKGNSAGPYCLADGQALCNTMHDRCLAKLVVVRPKGPGATGQLPKQKTK